MADDMSASTTQHQMAPEKSSTGSGVLQTGSRACHLLSTPFGISDILNSGTPKLDQSELAEDETSNGTLVPCLFSPSSPHRSSFVETSLFVRGATSNTTTAASRPLGPRCDIISPALTPSAFWAAAAAASGMMGPSLRLTGETSS